MTKQQLIHSIEQQLENLAHFDEDLAYEYECALYYDCNEDEESQPIVENFTLELLTELEHLVYQLDNHDRRTLYSYTLHLASCTASCDGHDTN